MKKNINIGFKEFKEKIHKPFYEHWLTEFIFRPISNKIVFYLVKYTNLKPNQITLFSLFIVLLSSLFIFYGTYINKFILIGIGFFGFILFHLFDVIDGDLARARIKVLGEESTLNGSYFDALIHQYYNFVFFLLHDIYCQTLGIMYYLIFGILAGFLLTLNDQIFLYIDYINTKNNLKNVNKTYRSFKNDQNKISFKKVIISFLGMIGFSILFFIFYLLFLYLHVTILVYVYILMILGVFYTHIKTFIQFYNLK